MMVDGAGPRVLIAADKGIAELLRSGLSKHTEYQVEVTTSINQAKRKLSRGGYRWLLIAETVAVTRDADYTEKSNGVEFAKKCLQDRRFPDLRAIVLTHTVWDDLGRLFNERLCGISLSGFRLNEPYLLIDMMRAGEAGSVLTEPTTITLKLGLEPEGASAQPRKVTAAVLVEGPLKGELQDSIDARLGNRPLEVTQNFAGTVAEFRSMADGRAPEPELLAAFSHNIFKGLRPADIFSAILSAVKSSVRQMVAPQFLGRGDLSIVQVHLKCGRELLSMPIDLALRDQSVFAHLCHELPVSWRIDHDKPRENDGEVVRCNPTHYKHFRAVYSCSQPVLFPGRKEPFAAIPQASASVRGILQALRLSSPNCALLAVDVQTFLAGFAGPPQVNGVGEGRCAYVLSHGQGGSPKDQTGVVVGPNPVTSQGELVKAEHLSQRDGGVPLRFVFVNCCDLGQHDTNAESKESYIGSFLQGLFVHGVCAEAICNRWPVHPHWATLLATEFYKRRPQTAQGRAAALFFARRRVREMMKDPTGPEPDASWLAPVHVWGH
jgi:hypothetical protein